MSTASRSTLRTVGVAARAMVLATVVLGIVYTLVITGVGQLLLPAQANGSLLRRDGQVVGSTLIGQSFSTEKGTPLPQYFQPRPSAATAGSPAGYDAGASSGSNYGPENPDLVKAIRERKKQIAAFDGVAESQIPADAVTASASGLDPHISPAYAAIQVARVARERGLTEQRVRAIVAEFTTGRDLGYLGEPTVNVVQVNAALDALKG
jgi:potassium-transporting ATPase KdpC subunit